MRLQEAVGALLTRDEKIALYDKAILESLNNSGSCQPAGSGANAGAGGGGGGAGGSGGAGGAAGGAQASGGSAGAGTAAESIPASGIQGDRPASEKARDGQSRGDETNVAGNSDPYNRGTMLPNGKVPEDIPPAYNDDIIAQQFRQAAMEETDPVTKAKLWNEYRRYKNLPVQEVPEN